MTDQQQVQPGQLMRIGAVAAQNIAHALSLPAEAVSTVEKAIKDEIDAMSSHFTLAFADIQTQYDADTLKLKTVYDRDVAEIKATWTFLKAHPVAIGVAALAFFLVGVGVGLVI